MITPSKSLSRYFAIAIMAGFVLGVVVGVIISSFIKGDITYSKSLLKKQIGQTAVFENFIVQENKSELRFLDRDGNEMLIIEKQ